MTASLSALSSHRRECEICPRDAVGQLHIPQRGGRYHLCARHYIRARQDGTGKVVVGDADLLPSLLASAPRRATAAPPPPPKPREDRVPMAEAVTRYRAAIDSGARHHDALRACGRGPTSWREVAALSGYEYDGPLRGRRSAPLTPEELRRLVGLYRAGTLWQRLATEARRGMAALRAQLVPILTHADEQARRSVLSKGVSERARTDWQRRQGAVTPCGMCSTPTPAADLSPVYVHPTQRRHLCPTCAAEVTARTQSRPIERDHWQLSAAARDELARLWRIGATAGEAAAAVKCSRATVERTFAALGRAHPDDPAHAVRAEVMRDRRRRAVQSPPPPMSHG